jgi:hypothetical protein
MRFTQFGVNCQGFYIWKLLIRRHLYKWTTLTSSTFTQSFSFSCIEKDVSFQLFHPAAKTDRRVLQSEHSQVSGKRRRSQSHFDFCVDFECVPGASAGRREWP